MIRRNSLAALLSGAVVTVALCACGAGPSTVAAPSSRPAMYGGFCVPEKYATAYINAPDDGGASKEIDRAASNMISMAAIRGRDGGCWMPLTEDPCTTQFDRVVAAPKSSRPQMIRELEADLRYYDRHAVYFRVDENCFVRREKWGGSDISSTTAGRPSLERTPVRGSMDAGGTEAVTDDPAEVPSTGQGSP